MIEHRFGKQIDKQQEDKDRKPHHHANEVTHHANKLVAYRLHIVGRNLASKVARVKL